MSGSNEEGEKVLDPTPQKLEEERRKGNVPKSMDLSAAAGMIGLFIAFWVFGFDAVQSTGARMSSAFDKAVGLSELALGPGGIDLLWTWTNAVLLGLTPVFLLPFFASLLSLVAQRAIVVSGERIQPKLSNISPISNAKNKFGPTGLVQFVKSVVKMIAVSLVLFFYLSTRRDEFIGSTMGTGWTLTAYLAETLITILSISCIVFLVIGLFDILWQRFDHARKLRMSFQEVKDEQKQIEGDPFAKQQRRQRGMELANNRMLLDVPSADVIVVNPTHYAVALKWSRKSREAPVCVAKGVDEIAARIREIASQEGIPIHRDPPTARTLHDTVDIGDEIHPDHYKAVAAAIRIAETMRAKARKENWH